jgi:formate hydrogenlyase transcriptional activator
MSSYPVNYYSSRAAHNNTSGIQCSADKQPEDNGLSSESEERRSWFRCIAPGITLDLKQLLGRFLSNSDVGLAIFDEQTRYLAVNDALAAINGIPAEAHLGKRVREVFTGQLNSEVLEQIERSVRHVLTTGETASFEICAQLATRTETGYFLNSYFPIKDNDGSAKQVGAIIAEITQQKKLQHNLESLTLDLQRERDRLEMLLEVNNALVRNPDLRKSFPIISGSIRGIIKQDYASITLYDEHTDVLKVYALDFPLAKQIMASEAYVPAKSPVGRALVENEVKVFSREDLSQLRSEFIDHMLEHGIGTLCCIPLVTAKRTIGTLNLGSRWNSAFSAKDVELLKQVGSQIAVLLDNARTHHEIEVLKNKLVEEKLYLEDEIRSEFHFEEIIGESSNFTQVLGDAKTVAASDATVLILGETGTGKELVARAIHRMSSRNERTFVKLNCAAIPTGLLESELFGHEKGAFTGAISQKIGRMELADKGTLFLDEVGEIPLELQPKLLRVLQDQEFERLGSTHTLRINARIIAATNRDLAKAVENGTFRRDLFYRLNVFPIRVPPLRERFDDIPMLVRYFVQKIARRMNKHIESIPSETMSAFVAWDWPGNVRELENFIERSVILSPGPTLQSPLAEIKPALYNRASSQNVLEQMEREQIVRVLRETGGVIAGPRGAAVRLGLKRTTLQSRIQKLGIAPTEYES